jgi:hypothetical protein
MAAAVSRSRLHGGQFPLVWLRRGLLAALVGGMLLGLARYSTDPQYSKTRGWRQLAAALEPLSAGGDPAHVRLVQNYPDPTLWYYYSGSVPHLVLPPAPQNVIRSHEEVERLAAEGVRRIVLVEQPAASWDPEGIARDALSMEYTLVGSTSVGQWPVSVWLRPETALEQVRVEYEGGLQLTGVRIVPDAVPRGGVVEVYLRWQGMENAGEQEVVSLQLLNRTGTLAAQTDRPLAMASDPTASIVSYGILLPTTVELVDDEYQVAVVVYDPSRAGAPRRLTTQGKDHVVLGSVQVTE